MNSPEQIIRLLRRAEKLLGPGLDIEDVARHLDE